MKTLVLIVLCTAVFALPGTAAAAGGINTSGLSWYYSDNTGAYELGYAVSTAGDVNGDGVSDVLVGAHAWDGPAGTDQGEALVFLGSAMGPTSSPVWTGDNATAGSHYGWSVSTAGDVNGDGYDDIAVGTYDGETVYVYQGSPSGPSPTPDTELTGVQAGEFFGYSVNTAGDVNGDGYDDLLVGAYLYGSPLPKGRVALYLGSASGLNPVPAWSDSGDVTYAFFGYDVAAAGDVNSDGFDDILVGASAWDPTGQISAKQGKAYCYAGNAAGTPSLLWSYEGPTDESLGEYVSGAGDVNGDGYADILVGSPKYSSYRGKVNLFYGSSSGPAAAPSWTEIGAAATDRLGPCATAGDVNGDGIADFMISAPLSPGGAQNGEVRVYLGAKLGPSNTPVWTQTSSADLLGQDLGTAGDVNGDGFSDILIGAPYYNGIGSIRYGRAMVYYGIAGDLADATDAVHWGFDPGAKEGQSVADAGDVNGDGYGDVLVGAPYYDDGTNIGGQVQLFYGSKDGAHLPDPWIRYGSQVTGRLGFSVAGAGDVNGDGYSDFLVGDNEYDPPGPVDYSGRVDLYYGSSSGPTGPVWSYVGTETQESVGQSVDGAGDVNGDGFADIIVSAPFYDGPSGNANGRVLIFFGSFSGPAAVPDWETVGAMTSWYGMSVCGAGDLNADGFDDVIIGAPHYTNSFGTVGSFYVYLGSATGPGTFRDMGVNGSGTGNPQLGVSVSGAGDVNADGYADFVVSQPYYDSGGLTNRGRVDLFLGRAMFPLSASPALSILGTGADDNEGYSLSGAGDVNGDGYSDVISGAPYDATLGGLNGRARLFLGNVNGLSGVTAWSALGGSVDGEFGTSVSAAGDLNGDGFSDVIVGEPVFTYPGFSGGRIALYYGSGATGPTPQYTPWRVYGVDRSSGGPLHPGNLVQSGSVSIRAMGYGPGGRTRVGLEWEIAKLGTLLGTAVFTPATNWTDSGPVGPPLSLSATPLIESITGLDLFSIYHVRFRVATRSPYFPHTPWLTPAAAADHLAHFRTGDGQVGIGEDGMDDVRAGTVRAWPNPFRRATRLEFHNPVEGPVRMRVFDIQGRLVSAPAPSLEPAGRVWLTWDGTDGHGAPAGNGVYFVRVEGSGVARTARVLLVSR